MADVKAGEVWLGRIRITERAIEEVVDRTALVSVPRGDVRRVVLRRGVMAERPLFMILLGLAFTALGVYGVIGVVESMRRGVIFGRMSAALLIAAVGGPLMILAALRRGVVLDVSTERTTRKLGVARRVEMAEIDEFAAAAARVGVIIERS